VAEDMVDLGIDMWQGVIPQNDIKGVIERTEGKLCIMGGFDMQLIDFRIPPKKRSETMSTRSSTPICRSQLHALRHEHHNGPQERRTGHQR
jgi:hypothetical protein